MAQTLDVTVALVTGAGSGSGIGEATEQHVRVAPVEPGAVETDPAPTEHVR